MEHQEAMERGIHDAFTRYGYTLKEISDHLGAHYSTVSRVVKRVEAGMHHCKT